MLPVNGGLTRAIAAILLCAGLFCVAQAQVPMTGAGLGTPTAPAVCVSYTGPGDATSGAKVFYGVRSYTAATCGNKLLNVCEPTGSTCVDFVSSTSTGDLVFQTISGTNCGTTDTCVVKTAYDLTGNGFDLTQGTNANRPTLKHNCTTNNRPCLVGGSTVQLGPSVGTLVQNQEFTVSSVQNVTTTAANQAIISPGAGITSFVNTSGSCVLFAGSSGTDACSSAVWLAWQGQYNGASSVSIINATTNSGLNAGATNINGTPIIMNDGGTSNLTNGDLSEVGIWPGAANLYSNQSAWYGGF